MNCPKCRQAPMRAETHANIDIERCPVCKGIYLDQDELSQMITDVEVGTADTFAFTAVSETMDPVTGHCFRCDEAMKPYVGPAELRLDKCERCGGVFLDQGELATLQLQNR